MATKKVGDPIIDEIRAVRTRISARFDHDPEKLVQYYMGLQERHADRLIGGTKDSNIGQAFQPDIGSDRSDRTSGWKA